MIKSYVQRKALERLPAPVLDAAGKAVLKAVDSAVEQRWEDALERAANAAGETIDERVKSVHKSFSRELTGIGAATGAAAAFPGLGTASAVSILAGEVGWFAFRATDLVMTLGAVYGHTDATVEERRAWVLSVLAFGDKAAEEFAVLLQGVSRDTAIRSGKVGAVVAGMLQGDVATVDALRRINTTLAAQVMSRYGSRKGIAFIGKLLPFGVGAVVGGGANWALTRALSHQTRKFFDGYHLVVVPPPPAALPPPPAELPVAPTASTPPPPTVAGESAALSLDDVLPPKSSTPPMPPAPSAPSAAGADVGPLDDAPSIDDVLPPEDDVLSTPPPPNGG
ncbi:MAG: EcsC family protein [Actinomycetota bacterium]